MGFADTGVDDDKQTERPLFEQPENYMIFENPVTMDYDIRNVIGLGTYGAIHLCVHRWTSQKRSMEICKKESILPAMRSRMFKEMEILKELNHPNVLRLFEAYQDIDNIYIITELCQGGELYDVIQNTK